MSCSCGACYACWLRDKAVQLSPAATPNRNRTRKPVVRPMREPSWEKGLVVQRRPGGVEMPVLRSGSTAPMGIKELADNRRQVEEGLRRLHTDPNVLSPKE